MGCKRQSDGERDCGRPGVSGEQCRPGKRENTEAEITVIVKERTMVGSEASPSLGHGLRKKPHKGMGMTDLMADNVFYKQKRKKTKIEITMRKAKKHGSISRVEASSCWM